MLNRNLLYTGVTRAKKIAIVAGDPIGIKSALECTDAGKRRTWASMRVEMNMREIVIEDTKP